MERVTSYHRPCQLSFWFLRLYSCQEVSLFFRGLLFSHFRRTVHTYVRCERDLSYLMPTTRSTREGSLTEQTFSSLTGLSCALAYLIVRSSYHCSVCTNIQILYLFRDTSLQKRGGEIPNTLNTLHWLLKKTM